MASRYAHLKAAASPALRAWMEPRAGRIAVIMGSIEPAASAQAEPRDTRQGYVQDRGTSFEWKVNGGIFVSYPYAKASLEANGVGFKFGDRPANYQDPWWIQMRASQDNLDRLQRALLAEKRPNAAATVARLASTWLAIRSSAPASGASAGRAPAAEGRYVVTPNGFVRLYLTRPWGNRGPVDAILTAGKDDSSGAFYWKFKAKRAANLVAPALREGGFPGMAAKLEADFASVAESIDESKAACDPLRDMSEAPTPADVQHPLGRAAVEDVVEAVKRRFPAGKKPYPFQIVGAAFAKLTGYRSLNCDEMGLGKALISTAKVLTPKGWTTIGALKVGDVVSDPDGGIGYVEGVYPQGEKPAFRLETVDGGSTICCDEHLWLVQTAIDRYNGITRVLPLKQIIAKGVRKEVRRHGVVEYQSRYFLPVSQPIEFEPTDPPLDGYTLGVLLGDGNLTAETPIWSKPDEAIALEVARRIPWEVRRSKASADNWSIIAAGDLRRILVDLGVQGKLSHEKFIPEVYQHAVVSARLDLLRGLMDTNGDCTMSGVSIFSTSSPRLATDVVELVRSLGGFATTYYKAEPTYTMPDGERRIGQPAYRVNIRLPVNPFLLPRKAERWHVPNLARGIFQVTDLEKSVEMVCIRVSTKRRLYITDDHIVTHNTLSGLIPIAVDPEKLLPAVVVCPASVFLNWQKEINMWLPSVPVHLLVKKADVPPPGFKGIVIAKYTTLDPQVDAIAALGVQYLIVDEAQKIKNTTAGQTKAVQRLSEAMPHSVLLTGTPLENRVIELWSQLNVTDGERFPNKRDFGEEYTEAKDQPKKGGGTVRVYKGGRNLDELRHRLKCLIIRRYKKDVAKFIPPKTRKFIPIELEGKEKTEYFRADKQFTAWLKETLTTRLRDALVAEGINPNSADAASEIAREVRDRVQRTLSAEAMVKIMHLRQLIGKMKVPYALEVIDDYVDAEKPLVVFAFHQDVIGGLEDGLSQMKRPKFEDGSGGGPVRYAIFDGSTSITDRQAIVDAFQGGQLDVVVGSVAMAVGVTLTRASNVLFVERFWTPTLEEQAEDRCHRLITTEPVTAMYLEALGTVDIRVHNMIEAKRSLIAATIGAAYVGESTVAFTDLSFFTDDGAAAPTKKPSQALVMTTTHNPHSIDRGAVRSLVFTSQWTVAEAKQWARINGLPVHRTDRVSGRIVIVVTPGRGKSRTVRLGEGVSALVSA